MATAAECAHIGQAFAASCTVAYQCSYTILIARAPSVKAMLLKLVGRLCGVQEDADEEPKQHDMAKRKQDVNGHV